MAEFSKIEINGTVAGYVRDRHYAVCTTAAGSAAKTASLDGFELSIGAEVVVRFASTNTAASPTLDINGTGAMPIRMYGTTAAGATEDTSWNAGEVVALVYDGSGWLMKKNFAVLEQDIEDALEYVPTADKVKTFTSAQQKNLRDCMSAASTEDITDAMNQSFKNVLKVTLTVTTLPQTFNVTGMTADHELVQNGAGYISDTSKMGSDWSINPSAGQLALSGTFVGSGSVTVVLTMGIVNNKVTGVAV